MAYELFMDGFDHYTADKVTLKWSTLYGSYSTIEASGGRRNGGRALIGYNGGLITRSFTPSSKVVMGFAAYLTSNPSSGIRVTFKCNTTNEFYFAWSISGYQWTAGRWGDVVAATAANAFQLDAWNYIECALDHGDTGGFELRINGSSVGWIPFTSYDTKVTAGGYINNVGIDRINNGAFTHLYIDDCYITYGDEIKFLGDSRVDALYVSGDSTPQDWIAGYDVTPDVRLLLNANGANGSTNFTDLSAYAYTVVGAGDAKISTEQSKFGGSSIKLDGTGDYLYLDNTPAPTFGTSDFTIEMWVYMPNPQSPWYADIAGVLIDTRSGGTTDGFIFYLTGYNYISIWEHAITPTRSLPINQWAHIAMVRSDGVISIFVDGDFAGSVAATRNCTSTKLTIGTTTDNRSTTNLGGKFNGYIDGIRITKDVALYAPGIAIPSSELTVEIPEPSPAWPVLKYKTGNISGNAINEASLFDIDSLAHTPSAIHGVQVSCMTKKADAGYREAAPLISSAGTSVTGTSLALSTSDLLLRTAYVNDPATSSPWSKAAVNNAKIGVKVVA